MTKHDEADKLESCNVMMPTVKDMAHLVQSQRIASTVPFRRLKQLRQLGCAEWVFEGADHSRYEHSLGVADLACQLAADLQSSGTTVTEEDLLLLNVAGLCHDLGHGPFSHVMEHFILPKLGVTHWKHEDMSAQLLQMIVDSYNIDMTQDQLARVQDIIRGSNTSGSDWTGKEWMMQVVSSTIDVDRIDYLTRDREKALGQCPLDFRLLLQDCKVVMGESGKSEICFHSTNQQLVSALFEERYFMHQNVYHHHEVKGLEMLVADAIAAANPVLHFSEMACSPESFILLKDTILDEVHRRAELEVALQPAAALLRRMDDHDQRYLCVAEVAVPPEDMELTGMCFIDEGGCRRFDDQKLAADLSGLCRGECLLPADIRLQFVTLDHGRKHLDPLEVVTLHDGSGSITPASTGLDRQMRFMTQLLRVYLVKAFDDAISKRAAIRSLQAAFNDLLRQHCHTSHERLQEAITHPCEDPPPAAWLSSSSNRSSMSHFSPAASRTLQPLTPGLIPQINKPPVQTWDSQFQQLPWTWQQQQPVQQKKGRKRLLSTGPFELAHDTEDGFLCHVEGEEGSQVPVLSQYRLE